MKVFIITEGGKNIGFGHITRCLSLYQAFEERGVKPKFIVNGDNDIEYLLNKVNYQIFKWLEERNKLLAIIKDADIVIIDSYLADISVYNVLSDLVKLLVCIDDNKRVNYPKGIVLNGNIHAEELDYPHTNGVTYLLGTKYASLRKEFWEVPKKKIKEKIESIMVTFGGNDAKNMIPKVMNLLNKEYPDLKKNIIIGKAFHNTEKIKKQIDENTNLIYYPNAGKIKEIMLESDITISAGGQTLYELARIGVPTVGVCIAENQLRNVIGWEEIGFLEYVGWYEKGNFIERLKNLLKDLEDINTRKSKSTVGKKLIDGRAGFRIYESVTKQGQK